MRDDLTKLPLPASAKRYARMKASDLGSNWSKKVDMYICAAGDISNQSTTGFPRSKGGKSLGKAVKGAKSGFPNVDGGGNVQHTFSETAERLVASLISENGILNEDEEIGSWTENMQRPYYYVTSCVNANGSEINDMVDQSTDVSYEQFFRNVPLSEVFNAGIGYDYYWTPAQAILAGVGYHEVARNKPLTLKKDYHVTYYKSTYQGKPCYFICHSAIEYVFVKS